MLTFPGGASAGAVGSGDAQARGASALPAAAVPRRRRRPWHWAEHPGALYLLAAIPLLTDLVETGGLPDSPRGWLTEIVAGTVIALLVRSVVGEHRALQSLARTDALTGLPNRAGFDQAVGDECVRAQRFARPLSLVYIDLDRFKQLNDRDGHHRGDAVLVQLADAIRFAARAHVDRGFRLGGDEFALLLPDCAAGKAAEVLRRIEQHCAQADAVWSSGTPAISAGIVELQAQETPAEFFRRADGAMYRRKRSRAAEAGRRA